MALRVFGRGDFAACGPGVFVTSADALTGSVLGGRRRGGLRFSY
jgi:hypothetical protein